MSRAQRGILLLVAIAALGYLGDWAVFKLRGSPQQNLTVSHFISAPLKNNKQELDYLGSEQVACSVTLLPQEGHPPCWYLRGHLNQVKTY